MLYRIEGRLDGLQRKLILKHVMVPRVRVLYLDRVIRFQQDHSSTRFSWCSVMAIAACRCRTHWQDAKSAWYGPNPEYVDRGEEGVVWPQSKKQRRCLDSYVTPLGPSCFVWTFCASLSEKRVMRRWISCERYRILNAAFQMMSYRFMFLVTLLFFFGFWNKNACQLDLCFFADIFLRASFEHGTIKSERQRSAISGALTEHLLASHLFSRHCSTCHNLNCKTGYCFLLVNKFAGLRMPHRQTVTQHCLSTVKIFIFRYPFPAGFSMRYSRIFWDVWCNVTRLHSLDERLCKNITHAGAVSRIWKPDQHLFAIGCGCRSQVQSSPSACRRT